MELDSLLKNAADELARGNLEQSHRLCLQILKLQPRHPEAHFLLAINSLSRKQTGKAIVLLEVATKLLPGEGRYWVQLARAFSQSDKVTDAQQALERALALDPGDAMSVDTIGVILSRLGDHARAEGYFKRSLKRRPDNPDFLFNLASSQRVNGRLDEALRHYLKLYQLRPDRFEIYPVLAELAADDQSAELEAEFQKKLDTLTAGEQAGDVDGQLQVSHGIARLLERRGKASEALEVLKRGNRIKRRSLNYGVEQDQRLFESVAALCDQEFCGAGSACDSARPVFVVGMPRSGTTLLERILSSHSSVFSAGELQDFSSSFKRQGGSRTPQILDADTLRAGRGLNYTGLGQQYLSLTESRSGTLPHYIDKMPLNFLYAGFIHRALPNARIICLRRNPMDTVLSNFRQLFATSYSFYNYAFDLEDIARYYLLFDTLVKHWRRVLPASRFCEVHYETLVEDTEQEARRMVEFLDLPWQQQCLEFHRNEAPVATASAVQVRQPIYRSSLGRWKRLEPQLAPVKAIFDQASVGYQ